MRYVEVLIDLPKNARDTVLTYHLPLLLEGQVELGCRVLVKMGPRRVQGLVINHDAKPRGNTQPVIKVLDESPVISEKSFALAQWMAEYYCCSLNTAIKAMIPRRLSKMTGRSVIGMVTLAELNDTEEINPDSRIFQFMAELQEQGEISYQRALRILSNEELEVMQNQGLIFMSGSYSGYRERKSNGNYAVAEFEPGWEGEELKRRAPRQAEAMELIMASGGTVEREWLDKRIPASSLRALLQKGYIVLENSKRTINPVWHTLNSDQVEVIRKLETALDKGEMFEFLLYGVTGSGKTEVYIHMVQSVLRRGKSAMVLIPEIALTRHLVEIFSERFSDLAVIHSRMTPVERYEEWKRIRSGEVKLVLGTRSAVFAPLSDLGIIIIDEEQEHSYKQQEQPRYHAREVARQLAVNNSALLLLGSATPSFESFNRAREKRTVLLRMPERVGPAVLPRVFVADMRRSKGGIISNLLKEKIERLLERGEQAILFQNRRGFTPLTLCLDCGHIPGCPHCSVALTYHRDRELEICHYCNYHTKVLTACPHCGSSRLQQLGTGTQKVEAEVGDLFPHARIARLDLDSSQKKDAQPKILSGMKNGDIDILIGTQMVARGLDFPGVSLVGILDADNMLNLPDFRASERCFQLIVQAAGRAGRRNNPGEVVIQTYNPEHHVIQKARRQDYEGFFNEEIRQRRILGYPPFTHILRIVITAEKEEPVRRMADKIYLEINELGDAKEDEFIILGPAPCPLYYIKNHFRYQLIIKCDNILLLSSIGKALLIRGSRPGIKLQVEIDPLTSM